MSLYFMSNLINFHHFKLFLDEWKFGVHLTWAF